ASQYNMLRLDTLNLIWAEVYSGIMAPAIPRGYSATLLNDTSILYIGGCINIRTINPIFTYNSLDKLPLYNMNDNTWGVVFTSGNIPLPRCDHGTVFILLYGSTTSIIALDTLKFAWSFSTISNDGGPLSSLYGFASLLVGAYIFIGFGRIDDTNDNLQFISPTQTPTTTETPSSSTSNVGAIIGGTFGGIAGLIILITIAILIVKNYDRSHDSKNILKIPDDR
ncbi:30170_t:CDS:2, partial [Racocetra persica]